MAKRKHKKRNLQIGIVLGLLIGITLIGIEVLIITRADVEPEVSVFVEPEPEEVLETIEAPSIELPFGGRELLPDYTFVALYGSPLYPRLGALGEQTTSQTVKRAQKLAKEYQTHTDQTVIPTFEIITTIASAEATENDDYSRETDIDEIRPLVDIAKQEGMYVVLDLQPGRTSFLEQAMLYEDLLVEPHVGIALDPEWRLQTPQDRHLVKVGSVSASEINQTADWLADLTTTNDLPQKLFIIHQFKPSMISKRETLRADRSELAYVIHMDGNGTLGDKQETYRRITTKIPLPIGYNAGWKNFYDEDKPTPTPKQTLGQTPTPVFISYQ